MSRAGVVAALATEARAFRAPLPADGALVSLADGTLLAVSGVGHEAAARAAAALIRAGATGLISFGLAGGLDPTLQAGSLVLPRAIRSADGTILSADAAWRQRLIQALPRDRQIAGAALWSSLTPMLASEAKRRLFTDSGAAAVDMEAMAVASVAAAAAIPFLAVKVIVDTAADTLPRAVMAVDPAGRIRAGRFAAILIRYPGEIPALIRLAWRYRSAQHALREIANLSALRQPTVEEIDR